MPFTTEIEGKRYKLLKVQQRDGVFHIPHNFLAVTAPVGEVLYGYVPEGEVA